MNHEEFKKKFAVNEENGSFKLTAAGCFDRHKLPRRKQPLTLEESKIRDNNVGLSRSERIEKRNYANIKPGMTLNQICNILNDNEDKGLRWR